VRSSPLVGGEVARTTMGLGAEASDATVHDALMRAHFSPSEQQMRELDMNMRNQTNEIQNNITKYRPLVINLSDNHFQIELQ